MTVAPERVAGRPDPEKLERGGDRLAEDDAKTAAGDRATVTVGGGSRPVVHSQVRRIREEDLRIGEAAGEGLSARERSSISGGGVLIHNAVDSWRVGTYASPCSRPPVLPCSPLGNRAAAT